jgi:hypothetical protein
VRENDLKTQVLATKAAVTAANATLEGQKQAEREPYTLKCCDGFSCRSRACLRWLTLKPSPEPSNPEA